MKVTIIKDGTYSDFDTVPGKCGAVERKAGDKVNYPRWYALSLIDSGYARETVEVVEMTAPEVIPFSEPVLTPTVEWSDPSITQKIPDATDRAWDLAAEYDIDLGSIEGTGKDGRITAADVRRVAE